MRAKWPGPYASIEAHWRVLDTRGCGPPTRILGTIRKDAVRAEQPTLVQAKVTVDARVSDWVRRTVNVIDACGLPALDDSQYLLVAPAHHNTQRHQATIDCATSLR